MGAKGEKYCPYQTDQHIFSGGELRGHTQKPMYWEDGKTYLLLKPLKNFIGMDKYDLLAKKAPTGEQIKLCLIIWLSSPCKNNKKCFGRFALCVCVPALVNSSRAFFWKSQIWIYAKPVAGAALLATEKEEKALSRYTTSLP